MRNLKRDHFHRERLPDAPLYWRRRGDRTYRPFGKEDFAAVRSEFERAERDGLLG